MVYCETITANQTWVCSRSGVYKIICVGGGGAGYAYASDSNKTESEAGGTTAFGTYISADGGESGKNEVTLDGSANVEAQNSIGFTGGANGFDGACIYGAQSDAAVGYGYGASGAALSTNGKKCHSGKAGEIASIIIELDKDTSVACTIGKGGEAVSIAQSTNTAYAWSGKDGAIIIQYLGEM